MQIHPTYRANEQIQTYVEDSDTFFCFQQVDQLFDKEWCDFVIDTIASTKLNAQIRRYYVTGEEIGDMRNKNVKYYLQLC